MKVIVVQDEDNEIVGVFANMEVAVEELGLYMMNDDELDGTVTQAGLEDYGYKFNEQEVAE